jgi:chromosomal replication initiator protein
MTNEELWQAVLGEIELTLSKASFITWFKNTYILQIENTNIVVSVPNIFAKEWLENKYNKQLLDSIKKYNSNINSITCVIETKTEKNKKDTPATTQKTHHQEEKIHISTTYQQSTKPPSIFTNYTETNLNSRYSFDNFVVGSNNELAYAACRSVAEHPGQNYNPLFIYGGVGLGKTHLLQSTGNKIVENHPDFKIKYVSMERFANELVDAIQNSKAKEFKNKYIMLDGLILDDVQFLAKKEKTQEEFFHIFESLYQLKKQIILSSDCPPKSIPTLEDRLRSRFEGGMMVDINKPDFETRIAIINKKLIEKRFHLDQEIILYLAENIYNNVRELEGALNKIIVTYQLRNQIPTLEEVKEQTKDVISTNRTKGTTPQNILKAVADFYNIKEDEISNRSRKKKLIKPRQVAIYLLRTDIGLSFPEIGQIIGGRDHSTAIYAYEKINKELTENILLFDNIKFIREKILQNQ